MIAIRSAIVTTAPYSMAYVFRALAGLEPACVPLGLGNQAVKASITLSVSASVVPSRAMAVMVGVLTHTM